jgi:D-glycero-alpha-D-manno-heptose-7-phosphate kinase
MMFECHESSPTRVDLAGGTLDFWPIYLMLDRPLTINVAIDIFTRCHLKERSDLKILIHSKDLNIKKEFANLNELIRDAAPELDLIKAQVEYFAPTKGFEIETESESPIGGGLGGSSSLCISMIKAFSKWTGQHFDPYEMVTLAHNLEAKVLKKMTGTQDYFPAIFGDINVIEYTMTGPEIKIEPLPVEVFAKKFLLVYTGKSHHSGINNWHVIKEFIEGNIEIHQAFQKLKEVSSAMVKAVTEKKYSLFPDLFRQEFAARCELSKEFSSPEIDKLSSLAKKHNAVAKICGAGGGGCVMIWCEDGNIKDVQKDCEANGFQVLAAKVFSYEKT